MNNQVLYFLCKISKLKTLITAYRRKKITIKVKHFTFNSRVNSYCDYKLSRTSTFASVINLIYKRSAIQITWSSNKFKHNTNYTSLKKIRDYNCKKNLF